VLLLVPRLVLVVDDDVTVLVILNWLVVPVYGFQEEV
jgi:hypothetical protein